VADTDIDSAKDYQVDVPVSNEPFFLKGSNHLDWGIKNRLSQIFNPVSGRTVMLAFDHGYFLGPTSGLERIDLSIVPLTPYADTLMLTRGILRTLIPPSYAGGIVLRSSGGPSILKELSDEEIAISIDEVIRLNAAAMAVQVFVGGEHETKSIHNMTRLVDLGNRHGIATLAVTAVGRELVRDANYIRLAKCILATLTLTKAQRVHVNNQLQESRYSMVANLMHLIKSKQPIEWTRIWTTIKIDPLFAVFFLPNVMRLLLAKRSSSPQKT